MRSLECIVVHCTDSPDSMDAHFDDINRWHKEMKFSPDKNGVYCGYHFIVNRSGKVEKGRATSEPGIHTKGQNARSIGVVWVGRVKPTEVQYDSLKHLLVLILDLTGLKVENILGHNELNPNKTCPNLDTKALRDELRKLMEGFNGNSNSGSS